MRVLQLIDSLHAGGAERVAVSLANTLVNKVEKSYLCVTREEGLLKETIVDEVGYLYLNKKSTLDFKAIKSLSKFIKTQEIHIIHAHSSSFFIASIMRMLNSKLKIVWHDHYGKSEFLEERPKSVLRFCSRFFNHVFSVNIILKVWAEQVLKAKTVSYLPNFAVKSETENITDLKGESGKRIVCLANLRKQKDHHNLLIAFKEIKEKYPRWTLHLVGKDFKDEYSQSLYSFIKKENLNNHVHVYGSCPDTFAILKQSTIGVLSSSSEGLPIALLEYGLAGLPVIVTNVGECNQVLLQGALGQIVPSKNVDLMYNAIIKYIEDPNYREQHAKAFKQHINDNYSANHTVEKVKQTYLEILNY
ncbi:glycosyltransferase [uncultured Lacinutrix sp.]|uniref:glycosyltransferase n=1 Tax=uncultured Lacinutrix sp. TaxID=574032 RepID=UPI002612CC6C|nr:glycosyltransferase [uncultured Lacinutrix sp.]